MREKRPKKIIIFIYPFCSCINTQTIVYNMKHKMISMNFPDIYRRLKFLIWHDDDDIHEHFYDLLKK